MSDLSSDDEHCLTENQKFQIVLATVWHAMVLQHCEAKWDLTSTKFTNCLVPDVELQADALCCNATKEAMCSCCTVHEWNRAVRIHMLNPYLPFQRPVNATPAHELLLNNVLKVLSSSAFAFRC